MRLVVYYTERVSFLQVLHTVYVRIFNCLRYLDETLRISRAVCDQYDPEVGNIFEPEKRSYGQKLIFYIGVIT